MAKVLRLHRGAADTINNWDISAKIGERSIDSIDDPMGATDKKEITSIPSPFARIDLAKRAFKYVSEGNLIGQTAYHKLVSDCLDVGQIFFNIEKYRDKIEIIEWDRKKCIQELLDSNQKEHNRLGRTYETYLNQDCKEYNFDKDCCLYLLNYVGLSAPNVINIIGSTSPATLFFSSANNLEFVGKHIKFGNDTPFDTEYEPLFNRDFEYFKFLWSIKCANDDFSTNFPELDQYMVKCFGLLPDENKDYLRNNIDKSYYDKNYEKLSVQSGTQQYVTILGENLRIKKMETIINSGFEMSVSDNLKGKNEKIPLALPVDPYSDPTLYVISIWNKKTKVPYFDNRPINERTLPDDGTKYPYITISDFLEDTIVRIPYKFNSDEFFGGNDNDSKATDSFLLPLTTTFFNYFSPDDLRKKISGKNRIEISRLTGNAVKVVLRIPIKNNNYIQYERTYYDAPTSDLSLNKGKIINKEFTLGLFPSIKYADEIEPFYRIILLDNDSVNADDNAYEINFYDSNNTLVPPQGIVKRNRNIDTTRYTKFNIDSITYAINREYLYMKIQNHDDSDVSGIVIPYFASRNGSQKFRFAIDFGTTNTHIEYSTAGSNTSKAFDITKDDMQIQKLHILSDDAFYMNGAFNSDFIPDTIGNDSLCKYPMRTVISEGINTNWDQAVLALANVNIPFMFNKDMSMLYNIIHTDLKWSTIKEDKKRANKYIECILLLLRNKVLLNNGDLSSTEIVWFYPVSMIKDRFEKFKDAWESAYKEIFGGETSNVIAVSESLAPYNYNKTKKGATSTVVSIDIGGGTTDVLIADKAVPKYLTSFRFAANTIFGDGYSYDSDTNGFVMNYKAEIKNLISVNNISPLDSVLNKILENKVSTEIIAFFFSLADNKSVKNKGVEINFADMLSDDSRAKYVILLFYTAIIYHIANIMKAKGVEMPRHITFSGNGSKVLNILTTSDEILSEFTKLIFKKIYGVKEYPSDGLDVIKPENSKESTCKGGILISPFVSQNYDEIDHLKTTLLGTNSSSFVSPKMKYEEINENIKTDVITNVKQFVNLVFSLDDDFSFYNNFDIDRSIISKVKDLCLKDIKTYLDNGIALKKGEIQDDGADDQIVETLFFYPIVGMINAVVRNIYNLE